MIQNLYRHFDEEGELLYIGISLNSIHRLVQHRHSSAWFNEIRKVTIEQHESREKALDAEHEAIIREEPKYNIRKRYPKLKPKLKGLARVMASRKEIADKLTIFDATYRISGIAALLSVGEITVKNLIAKKELGCIKLKHGRYGRTLITGWQFIDFLENLEQQQEKANDTSWPSG